MLALVADLGVMIIPIGAVEADGIYRIDAKAPFPVLTDMDNGYAMTVGLAFYVGDELKHMMISSGWDPSVSQGTDNWMLPIPATFIVGTDGIVRGRFVDPDRTRMAIEDMLAALRSAT